MRNSATATSRTSAISRWSSAVKARASSVGSPGRSFALVTSSCAWLGAGLLGREQPAAAKARIEQGPGDAGEARRTTSEGVGHVAQPRLELPCLTLERKRVGARLDVLEERRHRVGNREPGTIGRFLLSRARLTRGVWRRRPRDDNGAERRQKARNQQPRQPQQTMRRRLPCRRGAHRATPVFGMLADSDSASVWRRSVGSCFHCQRRPPGILTSTSTGPA